MKEGQTLPEQVAELAKNASKAAKFVVKGEMTPPNISIPEADKTKEKHKQEVERFVGTVFSVLTLPDIASLVCLEQEGSVWNITTFWNNSNAKDGIDRYVEHARRLKLVLVNNLPTLIVEDKQSKKYYYQQSDDRTDREQERPSNVYEVFVAGYNEGDRAQEGWVCVDQSTVEKELFVATRAASIGDVTNPERRFRDFITGANHLLTNANEAIDAKTITEDQTTHLRGVSAACMEATKLVESAISGRKKEKPVQASAVSAPN